MSQRLLKRLYLVEHIEELLIDAAYHKNPDVNRDEDLPGFVLWKLDEGEQSIEITR